jgi:hypothetical protein
VASVRTWGLSLLLPAEPGRRNRRTIDGVLIAAAAILAALAAVAARSAPSVDEEIGQAVATVLGWAPGLWRAALLGTLALTLVVVVEALVRRRWLLARDVLFALVVVNVVGSVLARIVDSEWLQVETHPLSHWGFPELRIASVVAVIAVARPNWFVPRACSPSGSSGWRRSAGSRWRSRCPRKFSADWHSVSVQGRSSGWPSDPHWACLRSSAYARRSRPSASTSTIYGSRSDSGGAPRSSSGATVMEHS